MCACRHGVQHIFRLCANTEMCRIHTDAIITTVLDDHIDRHRSTDQCPVCCVCQHRGATEAKYAIAIAICGADPRPALIITANLRIFVETIHIVHVKACLCEGFLLHEKHHALAP